MKRALVLLATLSVAGCGPRPAEQAEICAIFALPGVPGDTQLGDASDVVWAKARERALFKSGVIYGPPWQLTAQSRSWGRCPAKGPGVVEHLLISPDRRYAMTKGGRRADGHPVSFGSCYYEKGSAGWRLRACRQTLDEPVPLVPQMR